MSEIRDEPAFPHIDSGCGRFEEGMTLRDYFAAKILQATCYPAIKDAIENEDELDGVELARICYGLADAMLIVRAEDE